jgi:3-methyladenine DNA glycosylase AlkD
MKYQEVLHKLKSLSDPDAVAGMARYGIRPAETFGVSIPNLRKIAKEAGRDHGLARMLWAKDTRETRILASMIEEPELVTAQQMDAWVREFDYWEICDQCCMNLFEKTKFAYEKALEWSRRQEEFVRRAGFVMMARLAVSDKKAGDEKFEQFLPIIKRYAGDGRNFVKKAVNWALRQIGKRNPGLNRKAIGIAEGIKGMDSPAAKWVASDALRELKSGAVQRRLSGKK